MNALHQSSTPVTPRRSRAKTLRVCRGKEQDRLGAGRAGSRAKRLPMRATDRAGIAQRFAEVLVNRAPQHSVATEVDVQGWCVARDRFSPPAVAQYLVVAAQAARERCVGRGREADDTERRSACALRRDR